MVSSLLGEGSVWIKSGRKDQLELRVGECREEEEAIGERSGDNPWEKAPRIMAELQVTGGVRGWAWESLSVTRKARRWRSERGDSTVERLETELVFT